MWRGPEKETARVPPSLDSPLSAAPETFLSRDAVSAFPIALETLPQSLPGARYPGSAALLQSPWRFFWNRARPLRGTTNWPDRFLASDSQSRPRSPRLPPSVQRGRSPHCLPCPYSPDRPRALKPPPP